MLICSKSLLSTTFSTTFDRNLRLEIGSIWRRIIKVYGALLCVAVVEYKGVLYSGMEMRVAGTMLAHCSDDWSERMTGTLDKPSRNRIWLKPRLHDTTGFDNRYDNRLSNRVWQPVVKRVVQPGCTTGLTNTVWQPCWTNSCSFNRLSNRLYNRFDNGFDNRLTTGCIVYTNIYPVVKPVWRPVWQQVVSCKQGFRDIAGFVSQMPLLYIRPSSSPQIWRCSLEFDRWAVYCSEPGPCAN